MSVAASSATSTHATFGDAMAEILVRMRRVPYPIPVADELASFEGAHSSTKCMVRLPIAGTGISSFPVEHRPVVTPETSLVLRLRFCYTFIASAGERQTASDTPPTPNNEIW